MNINNMANKPKKSNIINMKINIRLEETNFSFLLIMITQHITNLRFTVIGWNMIMFVWAFS